MKTTNLNKICRAEKAFLTKNLNENSGNAILLQDSDGDFFMLFATINKINIQSLNSNIVPTIYGDVTYKVVERFENVSYTEATIKWMDTYTHMMVLK